MLLAGAKLFWLVFAIPATFLFAYVSSQGVFLLAAAAKKIRRDMLVRTAIVVSILLGTYAACFTPYPSWSLSLIMNIYRATLGISDEWINSSTKKNWFRLPLPPIVQQTTGISHAMCLAIGLFVVSWVRSFIDGMKKRGIEEYQYSFIEGVLSTIFQLKFFLGCFLWYRYFLMPIASPFFKSTPTAQECSINGAGLPTCQPASSMEITTFSASILGLSHTLAFSIGFICHHDYYDKGLNKLSEPEVMRYYLSYAGLLIAARLAFQAICDATGLDPTSHDIVLLSAAIAMFLLLNNKSLALMNYFWLPLAAGLISVIPALDSNPIVEFLMPYVSHNRELLALLLVGSAGFVVGVHWSVKPWLASLKEKANTQNLTSTIRPRSSKGFPPPFPNGWYRLANSDEIRPGGVRSVEALGRSFAVFRGEDGVAAVLDALCPHLGANIAIGSRVVGNEVECPFHGWRFDKSGKCTHVPYTSNVSGTIPDVASTRVWPSRETAGVICVYFDAEGRDPLYEPRPFPLKDKSHYYVTGRTATLQMHIQDFCENAADWMHFGKVHTRVASPVLDRFLYLKHRTRWAPSTGDDGPLLQSEPPHTTHPSENPELRYLPPPTEIARPDPSHSDPDIHHFTFFDVPSLHSVFSDKPLPSGNVHARVEFTGQGGLVYFRFSTPYGEITAVKTFLPLSPNGLLLHMRDDVYAERSVPLLMARYVWAEAAKAFDDDIFLWVNKGYSVRPVLLKEDRAFKKFREFYKRNYSENSRTFAFEGGIDW